MSLLDRALHFLIVYLQVSIFHLLPFLLFYFLDEISLYISFLPVIYIFFPLSSCLFPRNFSIFIGTSYFIDALSYLKIFFSGFLSSYCLCLPSRSMTSLKYLILDCSVFELGIKKMNDKFTGMIGTYYVMSSF